MRLSYSSPIPLYRVSSHSFLNMEHPLNDASPKGLSHSPTKIEILPTPIPPQDEGREGLLTPKAILILGLWYFFSFVTLFLNKYILTTLKAEAVFFGKLFYKLIPIIIIFLLLFSAATVQMLMTTVMGFVNMYFPMGMYKPIKREGGVKPPNFYRNMIVVGSTRLAIN